MLSSFQHAFEGIGVAFGQHPHFRIHIVIGLLVLLAAAFFRISRTEVIIIVFTINMMLIVEMINTSVEEITNLITIKWAKQAKVAKDVAAGMALVTAVGTSIVGFLIFIPYISAFLS